MSFTDTAVLPVRAETARYLADLSGAALVPPPKSPACTARCWPPRPPGAGT